MADELDTFYAELAEVEASAPAAAQEHPQAAQAAAPPQLAPRPVAPPPEGPGGAGASGGGAGAGPSAAGGGAHPPAPKPKFPTAIVPGEPDKRVGLAVGKRWVDPTLTEWPENDFRIFVGNLGNEVSDAVLQARPIGRQRAPRAPAPVHAAAFQKYPSFVKAKVIRYKHNQKPRGYGFVSLMVTF
eukprot:scaffold3.g6749.t1